VIRAEIIADSLAPCGKRLTTFLLTYPRYIHAEVMTHRQFSRNAASSRAIPIHKMLKTILKEPATPVSWGANGKGMQASGELPRSRVWVAKAVWLVACYFACASSWLLSKLGVHKQLANRLTEPFAHMTSLVTATEWDNFFALRAHPDAQPEFQRLADLMLFAYVDGRPRKLSVGDWHLPFVHAGETLYHTTENLLKMSVARCARTSYVNFDAPLDAKKDYELHDRLLASGHMSPFEHQGLAWSSPVRSANFVGYSQYRRTLPNEQRVLGPDGLRKLYLDRKKAFAS
jgi:thymidylate synthase ThyX